MKVKIAVAVAAIVMSFTASAQINFGVKGGLNLYNIAGDDTDADMKAGFHIGALSHIHLSESFALQPELVFSMQGAQNEVGGVDQKLNLNYLNVPVLVQYMFDNGFRIQAGPQVGFLLSAKNKVDDNSVDVKDGFKGIDVCGIL